MNKILYATGILSSAILCWFIFHSIGNVYIAGTLGMSKPFRTVSAVVYLFAFFGYAILMDLIGLIRVKTTIVKVLSIIGISLSLLASALAALILNDPASMSFDEVGMLFFPYAIISFTFSIIGLIQSIRLKK
ncbi:MAG: hypothetical protein QE487_09390 [Fluviicola sp.]|nr:hypothetical protein [Fluviicola sp.]